MKWWKRLFHTHSPDVLLSTAKCAGYDSMGDPMYLTEACEEYKCLKCGERWWKLPYSAMGHDIYAVKSTVQFPLFS